MSLIDDSVIGKPAVGMAPIIDDSVIGKPAVGMAPIIDDSVFYRKYDYEHYNCLHFACEMLEKIHPNCRLAPEALIAAIREYPGTANRTARSGTSNHAARADLGNRVTRSGGLFRRGTKPSQGSLCLFKNPASEETHVGVFYQGRVLHIQENGVKFQPLHMVLPQFRQVSFYDYLDHN